MKKFGITLLLSALVIAGCTSTPKKKKQSSSVNPTTESSVEPTSASVTSQQSATSYAPTTKSSATSYAPTTASSVTSITPTSGSTSSTPTPVITTQKIGTILSERKIGELVSFQATYLRKITLNNDAVLMFADETGYIGFRCVTNSDYINNTYRFHECKVTGKLVETDNCLEVAYDSSFGDLKASMVRLSDSTPLSYDEVNTTLPIQLTGIDQIEEKAGSLKQDNKHHAYGEIVRFTAQYAQNEDDNSNTKTLFVDDKGKSIVIIQDSDATAGHRLQPLMDENNFGKWYELTGIISIRSSIPAVLAWTCTYVPKSETEESEFDVTYATDVTETVATEIFKGNLTQDHFRALDNASYFKLYHAEGWVVSDNYSYGFTLKEGGKLTPDGTNTIKGFYFVNGVKYSFEEFEGTKIDIWFKIESYNTQHHIWTIFLIQSLLPQVY